MSRTVIRKAIINTLKSGGGNVKDVSADGPFPGQCIICEDNSASSIANILPPFEKGSVTRAYKVASQAEVAQIALVGRADETVVADTRYQIILFNNAVKEGQKQTEYIYNYKAPATLTGTPATDRYNMYYDLVNKINAKAYNKVGAYLVHKVAFTAGQTALPQVGETVTQETSGVTAKIAAVSVTSGTINATTAAGYIWLYDVSDTSSWLSASKTLTGGTSGFVCTAAVDITASANKGQGMVIVDDGDYFPARPSGASRGKTGVMLTAGFTGTDATVEIGTSTLAVDSTGVLYGRTGVYSRGIGSRMSQNTPVFAPDGETIVTGEADQILNEAVDTTKTYTEFHIIEDAKPSSSTLTGYSKNEDIHYVLYANESNSGYLTALESAIESALSVTIV